MAKRTYIGVSGKARKIKKMYVGVSGKARKIKKAYIGVAGKARLFFSSGELSYYGTATPLSSARSELAGASAGGVYAVFAGGHLATGSTYGVATVDAYNAALTRVDATDLSAASRQLQSATTNNYAMFTGGTLDNNTDTARGTLAAYNSSLTQTKGSLSERRTQIYSTGLGEYGIFAGGNTAGNYKSTVDVFDASLTRTNPGALLIEGGCAGAATTAGEYAIFAGGMNARGSNANVSACNTSFTRIKVEDLSGNKSYFYGASNGNYALFAGGMNGSKTTVDTYDSSLTKVSVDPLSVGRYGYAAVSIGNQVVFAGGLKVKTNGTADGVSASIDTYDESLTRNSTLELSEARTSLAGAVVGENALFAGGSNSGSCSTVDVFKI